MQCTMQYPLMESTAYQNELERKYTMSQKNLDRFLFEHNFNFRKYCPILIILSLLQTEIICPQTQLNFPLHL